MAGGVGVIVPAAGLARRFGGKVRKPFVRIDGHPLLAYVLLPFQKSRFIRWIVVVVPDAQRRRTQQLIKRYRITKALAPCIGGRSRSASVANGLARLPKQAPWVMIHDGARPCVTVKLIDSCVRAVRKHKAVACGLPAALTVKQAGRRQQVKATLDRRPLWFIQTPQAFSRRIFGNAIRRFGKQLDSFPDDAAIVEKAGIRVHLVMGDPWNIKVTTPKDLVLVKAILKARRSFKFVSSEDF